MFPQSKCGSKRSWIYKKKKEQQEKMLEDFEDFDLQAVVDRDKKTLFIALELQLTQIDTQIGE